MFCAPTEDGQAFGRANFYAFLGKDTRMYFLRRLSTALVGISPSAEAHTQKSCKKAQVVVLLDHGVHHHLHGATTATARHLHVLYNNQ